MEKIRAIIIIVIGIAVLAVAGFVYQDFGEYSQPTHGSADDNVSGWGWSDGIGWIGFNCTDFGCGSSDYGVNVDLSTGDFSGYAWSDAIGWITFDPAGPYPAVPEYPACIDVPDVVTEPCDGVGDYETAGWARALMCESNPADCVGWDGWILLGDPTNSWANQVSVNPDTKEFEGWAWGDQIVGWISFNCKGPDMCGE